MKIILNIKESDDDSKEHELIIDNDGFAVENWLQINVGGHRYDIYGPDLQDALKAFNLKRPES